MNDTIQKLTYIKLNCLKKNLLILSFIVCFFSSLAQTVRRPVGALYTGLGAYSLNEADVFSFTNNQGSLAQMKNIAIGVYGEKRFMLNELSLYQLALAIPTHSGNFGIKSGYFGFSDYNETQIGFAYGRKLGKNIDLGVQFNYNGISIAGYGNAGAINFEIGTVLHLTDKLSAGFHAYNPVGGKFGKDNDEKLASIYTVGFGYEASPKFFLSAEIEKEEDQVVSINAGLQYKIISQLMIRGGIATNTSSLYGGAGLYIKSLRIDVLANYHPQLGVTPGLLFVYSFSKKDDE